MTDDTHKTAKHFALGVEYAGTAFSGWQIQPDARTVQTELERAISFVANHSVDVICAGRTDAGVHALMQVVNFSSHARRRCREWLLGINSALPADVSVSWVHEVNETFHARFSAQARHYRYVILNREYRSALSTDRACFEARSLDASRMHEAAQALVGEHDFSAFRAAGCQARSPVRQILAINVARHGDFIVINVCANAFLQNMVRIISGSLMRVGRGEASPDWLGQILAQKNRSHLGTTAPANGLYFVGVDYPQQFSVPSNLADAHAVLPFLPSA